MSKHIVSHLEFEQNGELKRISLVILGMLWCMNGIWCFITALPETSSKVGIRKQNARISLWPSRTVCCRSEGNKLELKSIMESWSLVIVHGSDLSLFWLKFISFKLCACLIEKGSLVISLKLRSIWLITEHLSRFDGINFSWLFDKPICDRCIRIFSPSSQLQSLMQSLSPILFLFKLSATSFNLPIALGSLEMSFPERSSVVKFVRLRIPIGIWDKPISLMLSSRSVRGNPFDGNAALLLTVSLVTCSGTLLLWLKTRSKVLSVFKLFLSGKSWSLRKLRKALRWTGSAATCKSISGCFRQKVHFPASTNLLRMLDRFPVISTKEIHKTLHSWLKAKTYRIVLPFCSLQSWESEKVSTFRLSFRLRGLISGISSSFLVESDWQCLSHSLSSSWYRFASLFD